VVRTEVSLKLVLATEPPLLIFMGVVPWACNNLVRIVAFMFLHLVFLHFLETEEPLPLGFSYAATADVASGIGTMLFSLMPVEVGWTTKRS
jgi:hypothetical protein